MAFLRMDEMTRECMDLRELIARLEREPASKVCRPGFGMPGSYLGHFKELAFAPREESTVGEMLRRAQSALNQRFVADNGVRYLMTGDSIVNIAAYDQASPDGDELTHEMLDKMLSHEMLEKTRFGFEPADQRPAESLHLDSLSQHDKAYCLAKKLPDSGLYSREAAKLLREQADQIETLSAGLRQHIRLYRVADEAADPEAEVERLLAAILGGDPHPAPCNSPAG